MMLGRIVLIAAVAAEVLFAPAAAHATFPGRDGTIAVEPLRGRGLVLVGPANSHGRRLCPTDLRCGPASAPSWSVDGRLVAFGLRMLHGGVEAMYPDGSCFSCVGSPVRPVDSSATTVAFSNQPFKFTLADPYAVEPAFDTEPFLDLDVGALDWSSTGRVAVWRHGRVLAGTPGHLARLGAGGPASWSPSGTRLTFARDGRVVTLRPGGRPRRLIRGSAPVYAPNGRRIAFFGPRHRLETVAVTGGRPRRIGRITGRRAAWQPVPRQTHRASAPCAPASGEKVLATGAGATIGRLGHADAGALLGCTTTSGKPRMVGLVGSYGGEDPTNADAIALSSSATIAAVAEDTFDHEYFEHDTTIDPVGLRTGRRPSHGGALDVPGAVRALAVNYSGATAAITDAADICPVGSTNCGTDSVVVADAHASKTLATRQLRYGATETPFAGLTLTADAVGWTEDGATHSAPLP